MNVDKAKKIYETMNKLRLINAYWYKDESVINTYEFVRAFEYEIDVLFETLEKELKSDLEAL